MVQKIVRALVLIPLAIMIIAFAVANRQSVPVSFDPFDRDNPAFAIDVPLYGLILSLVVVGVIVGGVAAWVRQSRWRARARAAEAHMRELRVENERLKRGMTAAPPTPALPAEPRLSIPPPAG